MNTSTIITCAVLAAIFIVIELIIRKFHQGSDSNAAFEKEKALLMDVHDRELKHLKELYEQEKDLQKKEYDSRVADLEKHCNDNLKRIQENHEKSLEEIQNKVLAISQDHMKKNSEDLKAGNKEQISNILKPIQEKFEELKKSMGDLNENNIKDRSKLDTTIKNMMEQTNKISDEANILSKALRGEKKIQGNWGENKLYDLLEGSGMNPDSEYMPQTMIREKMSNVAITNVDEKGVEHRLIPDAIIKYPDDKLLVVDSKVTLNARLDYANAQDEETRNAAMKEFLANVDNHVAELQKKSYQKALRKAKYDSTDFVVMFIPLESAFQDYLKNRPGCWGKAYSEGVIIASPSTLIPMLLIIKQAWQNFYVAKNTQQILDETSKIIERAKSFESAFDDIKKRISKICDDWDIAEKRLHGPQGIITTVNRIAEMRRNAKLIAENTDTNSATIDITPAESEEA